MHRNWCLLGISALISLTIGCAAVGPRPEIRAIDPRISSIDLQGVDLAFDIDVHNPYPVRIRTPRIRYGVDIEDTSFIQSGTDIEVDLPASGLGTATLPVRIAYKDLWMTYAKLAKSPEVNYRLHGAFLLSALGQSFELPLSHAGAFPILRRPTFSVRDVDVSKLSLTQARVDVHVEVHNPNAFDVDLKGLGYTLRLGETPVGSLSASSLGTVSAGKKGSLTLSGQVLARSALAKLLSGGTLGEARLSPTGAVKTRYGSVDIAR